MEIREKYEVLDSTGVKTLCASLLQRGELHIAMDTETYYDEAHTITDSGKPVIARFINSRPQNKPFCLTMYVLEDELGYYIKEEDLHLLKDLLVGKDIHKIFHNLNYDAHMLLNVDLKLEHNLHDTMALAQLTDEERECKRPDKDGKPQPPKMSKALKHLGYHFLGEDAHEYEEAVLAVRVALAIERNCHKDDISYKDAMLADFPLMVNYAVFDTELTGRLFPILMADAVSQDLMRPYGIDMGAVVSGVNIERNGMKVDIDKAKLWQEEMQSRIGELKSTLAELMGGNEDFNPNSANELVMAYEMLYGVSEWTHMTDKGEYSTTAQVLKQFFCLDDDMTAFTNLILELRTVEKMCNTFVDGILFFVQHTGRVHPNFHVVANDFGRGGTVTGRLSSSNPNFQNFPKEPFTIGEKAYDIRELFVAGNERLFCYMDADQQEYRLLGHYGKDDVFVQFVRDGKDIHTATSSLLFNVPYDEVTKAQRKKGKTLNFGLVYGLGLVELASSLGAEFDKDAVKTAQKMLYSHYKAYDLPPHKPLHMFPLEKALQHVDVNDAVMLRGVKEYFSPNVQNALTEAKDMKKKYFAQFTGIQDFIKQAGELTKQRGWVKTWDGRKRHFKNPKQEAYKAPNSIIQGGCGSMLKLKLPELELALQGSNSFICNLVHDEVQFDMAPSDIERLVPVLNAILCDLPFRVPISWGVEYGHDWGNKFEDLKEA